MTKERSRSTPLLSQTVYAGSCTVLPVALRSSRDYLAAVGESDGASADRGRLGDDVFLYCRPNRPLAG